jgi:hypothetical protein
VAPALPSPARPWARGRRGSRRAQRNARRNRLSVGTPSRYPEQAPGAGTGVATGRSAVRLGPLRARRTIGPGQGGRKGFVHEIRECPANSAARVHRPSTAGCGIARTGTRVSARDPPGINWDPPGSPPRRAAPQGRAGRTGGRGAANPRTHENARRNSAPPSVPRSTLCKQLVVRLGSPPDASTWSLTGGQCKHRPDREWFVAPPGKT